MRRVRRLAVGAAAVIATIAVGDAAPASADVGFRALGTTLTGAEEIPAADPDGVGAAGVLVNVRRGRVCYTLAVKDIAPATLAHIHEAPAGVNGGIVVHLIAPTNGFSAACTPVDPALAAKIANSPENYYVNVHNADFPGGAVRGQLD